MNRLGRILFISLALLLVQSCSKGDKKTKETTLVSPASYRKQSVSLSQKRKAKMHKVDKSNASRSGIYDLDIGSADLGASKSDFGGISWSTATAVVIHSVAVTGEGFALTGGCGPGVYGATGDCTFDFSFTPLEAKEYAGLLRVSYSIDGVPQIYGYNITAHGTNRIPENGGCGVVIASIVNPTERTLMEEVPLVGTDFTLQYSSRLASEYVTDQGRLNPTNGFNQEAWVLSVQKFYDYDTNRLFDGAGASTKKSHIDETTSELSVVSADGQEIYVFDDYLRHIKTLTALTGATKYIFNYDADSLLEEVVDSYGNTTTIARNVNGFITKITAPYGQETHFSLDGNGRFLSLLNPKNEMYEFTYKTGTGLLATFKKPMGQVATFTYDADGGLLRDTSHSGSFLNLKKTSSGKIISTSNMGRRKTYTQAFTSSGDSTYVTTDSDLLETTIFEDGATGSTVNSNVISQSENSKIDDERFGSLFRRPSSQNYTVGGVTSSNTYAQVYNPGSGTGFFDYATLTNTSTTSGRVTSSEFDNGTKEMTITSPEGIISTVKVSSHENPIETKLGSDVAVTYSYDANGRLSQAKQGSREKIDYTYDASGYLSTVTNQRSEQVTYTYDLAGQVTQVTLPNLEVIGYQYNANGNIIAITPPHKTTHWFGYNSAELLQVYYPATSVMYPRTFTYNMDKQMTAYNNSGKTATYNYDAQTAKVSSVKTANGNYTYTYYGASAPGLVSALQSPYGVLNRFGYLGSMVASNEQVRSSDGASIGKVSFDFDTDHRMIGRTLVDSTATDFVQNVTLNDDNQPTQVGDIALSYDSTSGRLNTTNINKISDSRTYDSYGKLASYTAKYNPTSGSPTTIYSYTLTRDNMSRIVSISETIGGTTVVYDYTYNTRGWLTGVHRSTGGPDDSFTYDYNGNKTSQTVNGVTTTSVFDAEDRMTSFGSTTYAYDNNGDLKQTTTSLGANTYLNYDVFGNLTQATSTSGTVYSYLVDGQNRRVGKSISGTINRRYIYQDQLRIAGQLNASGVMQKEFVYATGSQAPDYMNTSSGTYRIITNHLGSVRLVVNVSNGTIVQRMDYDVLGKVTANTSVDYQPFGFAGGLYDQHTGLVRFGARDYDPTIGRWTTKDPIGFAGGDTNLYAYVGGNPMSYTDPSGLKARTCKRKLKHTPGMAGPAYHEYIEFDSGETFSFGPAPGESWFGGVSSNEMETGDGADCTEYSGNAASDAAIKARALQNLIKPYDIQKYNCQDFVKDSMSAGKGK